MWRNSFLYFNNLIRECNAKPKILCGPSSSHQYIENIKNPLDFDVFSYFFSIARNLSSPNCCLLVLVITLQHCIKIFPHVTIKHTSSYTPKQLTCSDDGITTPCAYWATNSSLTVSQIFKGWSQIYSNAISMHPFWNLLLCP